MINSDDERKQKRRDYMKQYLSTSNGKLRRNAAMRKYKKKVWDCDKCGKVLTIGSKHKHKIICF